MNVVLWGTQILLAAVFAGAGGLKVLATRQRLIDTLGDWVGKSPLASLRLLGLVEILAAAGLVLPAATGIAVVLTPIAAAGIVVVMVGAGVLHVRRGEHSHVAANVVLAVLAAFVVITGSGVYTTT